MSRRRFTVDEEGWLVDRDGERLGRLLSLSIELPPALGGKGGLPFAVQPSPPSDVDEAATTEEADAPVGGVGGGRLSPEREAIHRCWDYWLQVSGKRQRLDAKRLRFIRNALKIKSEEEVKLALLGLTRSPHHQGQNEQRKEYMEIRYALRGLGDESDDERIEKAISWAAMYAPGPASAATPAKVERWLEEVRYTLSQPHRPERERGELAYRKLTAAGYQVQQLDRAPWARITR